ncbi:zinc-dependent alcohol dehydrogenase [Cohnella silvisoli]|uniref:Alcohol dehydrogenase catalytic domain-containing protein n=1 Tax=Cohnella silvisoli TaxID=2873699 RepID=A0ABV1KLA3_9BACL|nr:alcohol dehydrogenase catalytic domain-containing protein [Cohnella silvisoli]MCD9020750.1 alcohol dehydrogenase catalytic domain-containing protein [Cohnella silvisoli]
MRTVMKTLQITGPGQYDLLEVPVPEAKEDEVLVEVKLVSTCPRWDINMMAGKDMFNATSSPEYPLPFGFPGHEMVGVVKAAGSSVQGLQVGDRVAALEAPSLGDGTYIQMLRYRENELIKLPDSVSDKQAVSFELLKCVLIGLLQFGNLGGKSVLVSGLGPAGIFAMQAAKLLGASRVVGMDLSGKRISFVNALNIGEAVHVDELGERRFDLGYDCVGYAPSVENVMNYVEEHVVIFGVLRGEVKYGERLWFKGLKLESYKYRPFGDKDRALLLELVARGLNTECIQTHRLPFTRYHEAVELLKTQEAIKVCFSPETGFDEVTS